MLSLLQSGRILVPGRHFIDILEPVLGSLLAVVLVPKGGAWGAEVSRSKEHHPCCNSGSPQAPEGASGVLACDAFSASGYHCQVAFAMEKASVVDLSGPLICDRVARSTHSIQ